MVSRVHTGPIQHRQRRARTKKLPLPMLSKMPIVGAVIVRADDMNEGPVVVGMNAEAPPSRVMIKDGVMEKDGFLANLRRENRTFV